MTRSPGPVRLGPASIGRSSIGRVDTRAAAVRAAAILLGAGCVVWATAPPVHKGPVNLALILAIGGVAGGALRLILAGVPVPDDAFLLPAPSASSPAPRASTRACGRSVPGAASDSARWVASR